MKASRSVQNTSIIFLAMALACFAASFSFAFAGVVEPGLGSRIVCRVFTDLDAHGHPIPHLLPNGCSETPPPGSGTLKVVKVVSGGSARSSDFSIHIKAGGNDIDDSPQPGSSSGTAYTGFPPGAYSVSETGGPSGYTATFSGACNATSLPGQGIVTIAVGDILTCTITNTFHSSPPPSTSQCSDGLDNDEDGKIDSADPGCHTDFSASNTASFDPARNDESASAPSTAQCSDGSDNDGDGKVDVADPGCHTDFNPFNSSSYSPNGTDESAHGATQCSDGADNDSDGNVDSADPGCHTDFNAENNASFDPTGNNEGASAPPSGGGSQQPVGEGGAPSGGGGPIVGSYGVSGGGAVLGVSTTTLPVACDQYLTAFIRMGKANDRGQVERLQLVLRDFEHADVEVNGVYDAKTLAAVHALQTKYAGDILTPWGTAKSTGYVYLTTRKKVNEIYCHNAVQFPLTPEQLNVINASRAQAAPSAPHASSAPTSPKPAASKSSPASAFSPQLTSQGQGFGFLSQSALGAEAATTSEGQSGNPFGGMVDFLRNLLRSEQ